MTMKEAVTERMRAIHHLSRAIRELQQAKQEWESVAIARDTELDDTIGDINGMISLLAGERIKEENN